MNNKIAIKNATVANEGELFKATVFICNEIIEKIDRLQNQPTEGYQIIDAQEKYLLPGVIDNHVHFREPGLTQKADIASESRAAVAGGVTSIMDMPNTIPQTTTLQYVDEKLELGKQHSLCNFSFYLGATNGNFSEVYKADPSKICGLKIFMGSSTGNMLVDHQNSLEKLFKESPLRIVAHCEEESVIIANTQKIKAQFGENPPFSIHPIIRDDNSCFLSTERAVQLAEKFGTRLHIAHLSTEKELSLFRNDIPLTDKKITAEACVQHLWFTDDDYNKFGGKIKCNPAIKSIKDRDALRNAINNNTLDLVATDHAPHTLAEKLNPYFQCPSGIPLIQSSLQAMLEMVKEGIFSLETIVQKMCHNPAILCGIEKRGFIKEGFFADLVLVDLNKNQTVSKENILYKCGWSPFEGQTFHSTITHTFVNGNLVWENETFNDSVKGNALRFKACF